MKHKGYTAGKWIDAPWFYENGKYRKTMVQTDKTAVAEVLDLYRPDDLENKEMQANARLIADAPRLAEEVERLRAAVESLLDMVTDNRTHGPEIDVAVEALDRAERGE